MKEATTRGAFGLSGLRVSLILGILLSHLCSASEIEPGMEAAEVRAALGEPAGTITLSGKTVLRYPRGEVTLVDGRVTEFDLIDAAAHAEAQDRIERERAEWLLRQEKLREVREAKGREIRQKKLDSSAFSALPAEDRLRYWRSFQERYPEVDVTAEIASAREAYEAFRLEEERRQEIEDLKREVAEAKEEAAEARREAERLRRELRDRPYRSYPVYVTRPHRPTPYPKDGKHPHPKPETEQPQQAHPSE